MNKKAEKDTIKQERLNQVYRHLYSSGGIHSQIDFAEKLKIQRTGISAAMNGNAAYLTKNLFMKICASFPGIFNLDYLLTGKGSLLVNEPVSSTATSPTDNMLDLLAQMVRRVDDLRQELHDELSAVRELKAELHTTLAHLQPYTPAPTTYGMAADKDNDK